MPDISRRIRATSIGWWIPTGARAHHLAQIGSEMSACAQWWYFGQDLKSDPPGYRCKGCSRAEVAAP